MKNKHRYPKNWTDIALSVKEKSDWTCAKCGMKCLSPDILTRLNNPSIKAKLTLTVHHSDYDPSNNHPSNLIPLCTSCHLDYHRGQKGHIIQGQLKLDLGV